MPTAKYIPYQLSMFLIILILNILQLNKLDGDATSARSYMSHSSPEAGIIHPPLENLLEIIRLGEDRKNVVRRLDEQCLWVFQ